MKQLTLNHRGINWHIYMSVDGLGLVDTTIYKPRSNKKWWQGKEEWFLNIMTSPADMSQQMELIKTAIDNKLAEEEQLSKFMNEFQTLEDVPFL